MIIRRKEQIVCEHVDVAMKNSALHVIPKIKTPKTKI